MYRSVMMACAIAFAGNAYAGSGPAKGLEAMPASFAEDSGEALRIESAGYLRTYTQEVAAAACYLHSDIEASLSSEMLREARTGFEKRLNALMYGDTEIGIVGGEKRRKTAQKLERLGQEWAPFADAVDVLLANPGDTGAMDVIQAKNMELLDMTSTLVSDIEAQYANPAVIVKADVMLLEIVGRQAMMSQKIAKDACKLLSGTETGATAETLRSSASIYEASLRALLDGMPEMGIQPAPTDEIAEQLIAVQKDWAMVRPIVDTLVEGGQVDRDSEVFLFKHMAEELLRIEDISNAYAERSIRLY